MAPSVEPSPRAILAYGALGLPLAFAALPIYVHVPKLYAEGLGLPLASVGAVLLASRLADAVSDPLIGWLSDRSAARHGHRKLGIIIALPCLALGFGGLLAPPAGAGLLWLAGLPGLVTLGYSLASISYHAWGAEAGTTPADRARLVAAREGFGLVGVVLAAALPNLLAEGGEAERGLAQLTWLFLPLLGAMAAWTLLRSPAGSPEPSAPALSAGLAGALAHRPFARLLGVFALNGIAAAIPSVTVLFFIADVLQAEAAAGGFLVLYFLAAAGSLPLWLRVAARLGKSAAWLVGMAVAAGVFIWASGLGSGEVVSYGVICVLAGVALGADLALPAALLADVLAREGGGGRVRAGACFGWWNLTAKLNLALAAGLALPLLAWLGYVPGDRDPEALQALAGVYAVLPVVLKLPAMALLWRWRHHFDGAVPAPAPAVHGGSLR